MELSERNKIRELTSKAVSINIVLLEEERRLIDALTRNERAELLKEIADKISVLIRKEHLLIGATKKHLQKIQAINN